MKIIAFLIFTSVLFYFVPKTSIVFEIVDKYCAKLKDGKLVVVHDGAVIPADVKLGDGSVIQPDGAVIDKDGAKRFLQDGECIDKSGKMIYPEKQNSSIRIGAH